MAAETRVINSGERYHALLSKRFDRTSDGRRIHFASAMTLLGLTDGCNAETGNGYQCLLINSTTNESNLQILLDSCEDYMITPSEARTIVNDVMDGVSKWQSLAVNLGISKREIDLFADVYKH